jgi:DNA-binding NarL/FixJ family response regulator
VWLLATREREPISLRLVLADDHSLTLHGIRGVLEGVPDIEIVAETGHGPDVPRLVDQTKPDMVLLDVRMPGLDGLSILDILRKHNPDVKVVLLSACAEPDQVEEGLRRGAAAYIVKSVNSVDLPSALRQAHEGTVYSALGQAGSSADASIADASGLTTREMTILRAVAGGMSNKAISCEMWITENTVKFHLTNIYRKLGVANRTAAARYAHSHGLLDDQQLAGSIS